MDLEDEESSERQLVDELKDQITEAKIKELIDGGYEQTSSKYRTLNRVPPGKTGLEALRELDQRAYEEVLEQANHWASEKYKMLCHTEEVILTISEFKEFRRQKGRKYYGP